MFPEGVGEGGIEIFVVDPFVEDIVLGYDGVLEELFVE